MNRPNIVIITTDQLTWRALPYYGDTYAQTPNIDRICKSGVGFDECYCPFPLCQPARAAIWSGIYPHETNVLSNGRHWPVEDLPDTIPTLGSVFQEAGYKTIHFGKTHDAGALRGFECVPVEQVSFDSGNPAWPVHFDSFQDRDTAIKATRFLEENGDSPYFMIAEFNNPHDICSWIGDFKDKHKDIDPGVSLPPLPENFRFDDIANRALPVQYICCSHNRQAQTGEWEDESFRYYLAAYYHYLRLADEEIGKILDALDKRPDRDNTLVVFMSDHGDSMAARRRVTKQVDMYEEVTRVPFIFSGPGISARGPIKNCLVSSLDLFPTLCSYAGITAPAGLRGKDLTGVLTGSSPAPKRKYVASQWHTEWGFTVSPGRMIRTDRYKYIHYLEGDFDELYDLEKDPYEKINVAGKREYANALHEMKALFEEYLSETNDNYRQQKVVIEPRWRSHKLGYQNHRGDAAPEAIEPTAIWVQRMRAERAKKEAEAKKEMK